MLLTACFICVFDIFAGANNIDCFSAGLRSELLRFIMPICVAYVHL